MTPIIDIQAHNKILELLKKEKEGSIPSDLINATESLFFHELVHSILNVIDRNGLENITELEYFSSSESHEFEIEYESKLIKNGFRTRVRRRPDIISEYELQDNHCSYNISLDQAFVSVIKDATLIGPNAVCKTKNNELLLESTGNDPILLTKSLRHTIKEVGIINAFKYYSREIKHPDQKYNTAISLVRSGSAYKNRYSKGNTRVNYAHWLLEDLPKLRMADHICKKQDIEPTILIDTNPPEWVFEALSVFGYERDDLVEWNHQTCKINNFILPSMNIMGSFNSEPRLSVFKWLNEQFKDNLEYAHLKENFSDKVYLSRRGEKRSIANVDEVGKILSERGFQEYRLPDLSFEEHMALFEQANKIISPFGAGLANIIFMEEGNVIEIFPENYFSPMYYEIADMFGLGYSYLLTKDDGKNTNNSNDHNMNSKFNEKDEDIRIDIDDLLRVLD